MCLDLVIQCLSGLDKVKATEYISFAQSNKNGEQVKQLEFTVGEMKMNMQILYEQNCYVPNMDSVGSVRLQQTKDAIIQTDEIDHSNLDNPSIQRNEQYQAEIERLKHENDDLKCKNNEQNQMIRKMLDEIELKKRLPIASDDEKDNNKHVDASTQFESPVDCQKCVITSRIIAQTQLDKMNLSLRNHRLTRSNVLRNMCTFK